MSDINLDIQEKKPNKLKKAFDEISYQVDVRNLDTPIALAVGVASGIAIVALIAK